MVDCVVPIKEQVQMRDTITGNQPNTWGQTRGHKPLPASHSSPPFSMCPGCVETGVVSSVNVGQRGHRTRGAGQKFNGKQRHRRRWSGVYIVGWWKMVIILFCLYRTEMKPLCHSSLIHSLVFTCLLVYSEPVWCCLPLISSPLTV